MGRTEKLANNKRVKNILLLRELQKANLITMVTKSIDENVAMGNEVLSGKQSYENFIKHSRIVSKYIMKLFKEAKNGNPILAKKGRV